MTEPRRPWTWRDEVEHWTAYGALLLGIVIAVSTLALAFWVVYIFLKAVWAVLVVLFA